MKTKQTAEENPNMKKWNNNPFDKNTPVVPFSSGESYRQWKAANCNKCLNYESESTKEEDAKCKPAFYVDLGTITGDIPLWTAKEIGCEYDPLYQQCQLSNICRKRRLEEDKDLPF